MNDPGVETKQKILDTAERLFSENGFDATSLRRITAEAGVNLAAVNYHFHSKEALIDAVIGRRVAPINQERLSMLAEAQERAAGQAPSLEEVVRAMVAPVLRLRGRDPQAGLRIGQMIGRIHTDPCSTVRTSFEKYMEPLRGPFGEAFRKAVPGLPEAELIWRVYFGIGVVAHTLAGAGHLRTFSGGRCDLADTDALIERVVSFICAGMRAPLVAPAREKSGL